jgi:ADP-ribose pyrophosphatase
MTLGHNDSAKPAAEKLGWKVGSVRTAFENKRFIVREFEVRVPGEAEPVTYNYAERASAVIIVPVTPDGKVVLLRQYRFPVDQWCGEVPAGTTGDTGDMPLEDVARKELEEEIGATAGRLEHVSQFYSAPSFATELCHVFIAWDVQLTRSADPEPTEKIQVELVSVADALRRAEDGRIDNGATALAICHCRRALERAIIA